MSNNELIQKQHEKIRIKLIKEGYAYKKVGYQEFLTLYDNYKDMMDEVEFASVLGINYYQLLSLKSRKTKTVILRVVLTTKQKNYIRNKLTDEGYVNKKIDYQEFLMLHDKYAPYSKEEDFAEVISLSFYRYRNIKNRGGKTAIMICDIDEDAIREEVKKNYGNTKVDYKMFLHIYKKYEGYVNDESKFASIIGLSLNDFSRIKNQGAKLAILKTPSLDPKVKNNIYTFICLKECINKMINYQEFLELYNEYKTIYDVKDEDLSELLFAQYLEIPESKYNNMRYNNNHTFIYKRKYTTVTEERKTEIRKMFILNGYANKKVTYDEFIELYSDYSDEMDLYQFAKILNISSSSIDSIKCNKQKVLIVLKKVNVGNKIRDKILSEVDLNLFSESGISYDMFENLYHNYDKYVTKEQFAEIIGVPLSSFYNLKQGNVHIVKDIEIKRRILFYVKEDRIYTYKEIRNFIDKYNISLDVFISISFNTNNKNLLEEYKSILIDKGLFIGRTPISSDYIKDNKDKLTECVYDVVNSLTIFYNRSDLVRKIAKDTYEYLVNKRGDIAINYPLERSLEIYKNLCFSIVKKRIKNLMYYQNNSTDEYNKLINLNDGSDMYINCIEVYYNSEYSYDDAIKYTAEEFNIEEKTLLLYLKDILDNKNIKKLK